MGVLNSEEISDTEETFKRHVAPAGQLASDLMRVMKAELESES
jgi:hypothetical protein